MSLTSKLNDLAGTTGLCAQGAAQVLSGTKKDLVGALNSLAGTTGLELQGVLNALAGTQGLGPDAAAALVTLGDPDLRIALVNVTV